MCISKDRENRIRMEAASQAIEKTIQMVEEALGICFPRVGTPSENREYMLMMLLSILGFGRR